LLRVKKVYQNYMRAGCHEIETECFEKGFFGEQNHCLLLLDLLLENMRRSE